MQTQTQLLLNYLIEKYGWTESDIKSRAGHFVSLKQELNQVLHDTVVTPSKITNLEEHVRNIRFKDTYFEFIDDIIRYMLIRNINNSLVNGYKHPTKNNGFTHDYFNPNSNFHVNCLKSAAWNCVFDIIGKEAFIRLLLASKLYIRVGNGSFIQLFGREFAYKFDNNNPVTDKGPYTTNLNLLLLRWETIALDMINESRYNSMGKIPVKYKGIKRISQQIYLAHKRCNYGLILIGIKNSMMEKSAENANKDDSSTDGIVKTPIGIVIKFVLTIMGKLFDRKIWGGKKNRTIITKYTINYIKYGDGFLSKSLGHIRGFSVKSVSWIGQSNKVSSIEELHMRNNILSKFLNWYFSGFVKSLLLKFWKLVSQNAAGGKYQVEYFPVFLWKNCSKKWMDDYVERFLYKLNDEFKKTDSLKNNFVGSTKLLPKTSGSFRLLCIPLRARPLSVDPNEKNEAIRYNIYIKAFIKPLQYLLNLKDRKLSSSRLNTHPKAYCVEDVAAHINNFRLKLQEENKLDKLYIVKFDMEKCYDNINQKSLLESVCNLFNDDEENKTYFFRRYDETFMFSNERDRSRLICREDENLDDFNFSEWNQSSGIKLINGSKALLDKKTTSKLSKSQIIAAIEDYVKNSSIYLKDSSLQLYKRHTGIFQGFPLLATLCNLFYNQLVDSTLAFTFEEKSPSTLIRLVDDFIFISASKDLCNKVFSVVTSERFKENGAIVNESKTIWIEGGESSDPNTLKFVGLEVNVQSLTVKTSRLYDPTRQALEKCNNFKELFKLLLWWYKTQLREHSISLMFGSLKSQLDNLKNICKTLLGVLSTLTNHFINEGKTALPEEFSRFILNVIDETLKKWKYFNNSSQISLVSKTLEGHFIKFASSNPFLKEGCYILKFI